MPMVDRGRMSDGGCVGKGVWKGSRIGHRLRGTAVLVSSVALVMVDRTNLCVRILLHDVLDSVQRAC